MWHRIWIVARSEFMRRARSKWFILGTLLLPLLFAGFIGGIAAIGIAATKGGPSTVAVRDESGAGLGARLAAMPGDGATFVVAPPADDVAALQQAVRDETYDALLVIPPTVLDSASAAAYFSVGNDLTLRSSVSDRLDAAVRALRIDASTLAPEVARALDRTPRLAAERLSETGTEADNALGSYAIGFGMGILIYMMMLISGQMVMMGVLEEKQSRVLEVMASSVRPFVLLMGKVLGIGAIGLVQVALWLTIGGVLSAFGGSIFALVMGDGGAGAAAAGGAGALPPGMVLPTLSAGAIVTFVLFFISGYLLYASLFAAIGSAVEQQQEAQSLVLPLMLPIIGSFVAMQFVLASPDSPVSVALSMTPFLSPVLMTARVAVTDVPLWQVALSLALLVATFVGAIWVSARIYRVGILSYGKKPSLADLWRWLRMPA